MYCKRLQGGIRFKLPLCQRYWHKTSLLPCPSKGHTCALVCGGSYIISSLGFVVFVFFDFVIDWCVGGILMVLPAFSFFGYTSCSTSRIAKGCALDESKSRGKVPLFLIIWSKWIVFECITSFAVQNEYKFDESYVHEFIRLSKWIRRDDVICRPRQSSISIRDPVYTQNKAGTNINAQYIQESTRWRTHLPILKTHKVHLNPTTFITHKSH